MKPSFAHAGHGAAHRQGEEGALAACELELQRGAQRRLRRRAQGGTDEHALEGLRGAPGVLVGVRFGGRDRVRKGPGRIRGRVLDARGVISVTERQAYIGRVRSLAKACAEAYLKGLGHL